MPTTTTTAIDIDAPPEAVWAVLTEFTAYGREPVHGPRRGQGRGGERARRAPGRRHDVPVHRPRRDARARAPLLGRLGPGRLLDGEHSFVLERRADGGTWLRHAETVTGILVPLLRSRLTSTEEGFVAFTEALRERVHAVAAGPAGRGAAGPSGPGPHG